MGFDYSGKRIVILGLARQGIALARYLVARGATVVISDLKPADKLRPALAEVADLPVDLVLGGHPLALLEGADLLCLSGGVPLDAPIVRAALARDIVLSNDSQIFLEACPATVVGITGSAGKTTTTALAGAMCQQAGDRPVWVGGNIGWSMLPDLAHIRPDDLVVMELSSFQLEIMTLGTQVAAVLNVTPNHLDRHKTMQVYTAAKARLLDYQPAGGVAVLGQDDSVAWGLRDRALGRCRAFSLRNAVSDGAWVDQGIITLRGPAGEQPVCRRDELILRGEHNVLNILAAGCLADSVGAPVEAIAHVARTFSGVEHRLQLVRERAGVRWYDDSIATAPERMMAALRSFAEPIVLLAGGRDKDLPWSEAACLIGRRVRDVVLFGEAADLICRHLEASREQAADWRLEHIVRVSRLEEAVEAAARLARPGDIVLLSPGGTSFDAFVDFAERGDRFQALVGQL